MATICKTVLALALVGSAAQANELITRDGMAGVGLAMHEAEVMKILGKPARIQHVKDKMFVLETYRYPTLEILMISDTPNLASISTTSARYRTAGGHGVGSTEAELKAELPELACEDYGKRRGCHIEDVLTFTLERGRVVSVAVGSGP